MMPGEERKRTRLLWRNRRFTGMLRNNFLLIALAFSALLLSVLFLAYRYSSQSVLDQLSENNLTNLRESVSQMENTILRTRGTLLVLAQSQDVEYYLRQDKSLFTDLERTGQVVRIRQMINGYIAGDACLQSISVYDRQTRLMISDSGMVMTGEAENAATQTESDTGWLPLIDVLLSRGQLPPVPRLSQRNTPVLTILQSAPLLLREWKGMVAANLDSNRLFDAVGGGFGYLATDAEGRIIGASDRGLIGKRISADILPEEIWQTEGNRMIRTGAGSALVSAASSVYGWWFYRTDTMETFNARMNTFRRGTLILAAAGLLLCTFFAYIISLRMFLPVKGLMRTLKERSDELALPIGEREETGNEIAYLTDTVLRSLDRNRELKDDLTERLQRITDLRLKMLRSQINPHFLYNTLASINWMVLEKMPEDNEISEAICLLSDLLRTALKSPTLVPLDQELEQAERYLQLQKLCLKSNVQWTVTIDPESRDALTPSMLLQPLAENAIKYGLDPESAGSLHIGIGVVREGEMLRVTVSDDGRGVSQEELSQLTEKLKREGNAIGLRNIDQKLQLIFEGKARLVLKRNEPTGFAVEIVYPYLKISDDAGGKETLRKQA